MHRLSWNSLALACAVTLLLGACRPKPPAATSGDEFLRLSNVGKAQLDRGEAAPALATFEKALALNSNHPDAKLNLANACLFADQNERALQLATAVLEADRSSATAYYVAGVAELHQRQYTNAIQFLQQAKDIDIRVNAVSFQLGLAYEGLGKFDEALAQYEEIAQFEPEFPGLHFRLANASRRTGRDADATTQLQAHSDWLAKHPGANLTPAGLERCKYTEARVPFELEQPDREGIKVVFTDATAEAFGSAKFTGPVGVIDFARDGTNHLLVRDGDSFRVLLNVGGKFTTNEQRFPFTNGGNYTRWLVADLNKDAIPDALVLGDHGVHLYRFATNGTATETTRFAGLHNFAAADGLFVDLNFRGDLDLVAITTNGELRVMSNLQNMYFVDTSTNTPTLTGVRQITTDDWNNDETQDLVVSRADGDVALLLKQRGGAWSNALVGRAVLSAPGDSVNTQRGALRTAHPTMEGAIAIGDMNNDLRPDLLVVNDDAIVIAFNGATNRTSIPFSGFQPGELKLIDYDNDGWLDILALGAPVSDPARTSPAPGAGAETGAPLRVFRNLGANGFADVTTKLGLEKLRGRVDSFVAADFDGDCDTDFIVSLAGGGLRFLRNDGGNKNQQLKLALQGNRSNSSGLGVRVDVVAGGLRVARRVRELPVELGVGKHKQLDAVNAQWFELSPSYTDIVMTNCEPLRIIELAIPTGSCPYLYCWDGERTRFVSDLLCSAPLGLPVAPGIYIEADEDEIVHVGNEQNFKPRLSREGAKGAKENYVLNLTEELREVLYLDEAKLIVVDHPPGTEVYTTEKMLARRPVGGFPVDEIVTLKNRLPLRTAVNDAGLDVTRAVAEIDEVFASPTQLRAPQLRGLAEPHSVTFEFGARTPTSARTLASASGSQPWDELADVGVRAPLPTDRPLVLALTGWLRFGGGMANIATSSYPDFPFPFPVIEAEVNGTWQKLDVEVGAPSGRAKTILVDLAGKLPPGAQRLRVTTAFEIHWDRAALFERADEAQTKITRLAPTQTDLHRRGYSDMVPLTEVGRGVLTAPSGETAIGAKTPTARGAVRTPRPTTPAPATLIVPDYARVQTAPLWRITPSGWATRYGAVDELIAARDNALALICGGDELTLEFSADKLPPKAAGLERDFFLFTSGWDKDSDFHVSTGTTIEPLPWHGMNDQTYGTQLRPAFTNDAWMQKYNTRWVGARLVARPANPKHQTSNMK